MWVRSLPYLSLCLPFFLNPKLSSHGLECYECRDLKKQPGNCPGRFSVRVKNGGRCRIFASGNFTVSQGPVARILCDPESLKVSLINLRRIYKYYGGKMRASCCDYDYCNTFESTIKNLVVDESRKSWKEDYRVIGKKVSKRPLKATENLFLTTHNLSSLTTPYSNILQSLSTATSVTMSLEYDYDIIENDLEIFGNDHIHSEDDIKEGHDKYFNEIVDPRLPENNLFRTSYLKPEDEKSGVGRMNYCFYRVSLILLVFASKIMTQCE